MELKGQNTNAPSFKTTAEWFDMDLIFQW
jgi:hypothetical protein